MRLLVPAEGRAGECRVAILPSTVQKFRDLDLDVWVQAGAGSRAYASDDDYSDAGAVIVPMDRIGEALTHTDIVASLAPLDRSKISLLHPGAVTVSFLQPAADLDTIRCLAAAEATGFSFDVLPRISRAQSMDALTSQALVAGYRAAIVAAERLPRLLPMFMTAAGTLQPAKVLVLGAGVAGLQAIATAKRLGGRVSAYDVRPSSAEEVISMGGTFIDLGLDAVEGAGGYAREMTEERSRLQRQLLAPYVADADVMITTAAIPGRRAPLLVTTEMVAAMRPGSVVFDLAAETGGNVEGSIVGEEVTIGEALVIGGSDVASQAPIHASQLYSMNVHAFISLLMQDGRLVIDTDDEIVDACAVVLGGEVRNAQSREALGLPPAASYAFDREGE